MASMIMTPVDAVVLGSWRAPDARELPLTPARAAAAGSAARLAVAAQSEYRAACAARTTVQTVAKQGTDVPALRARHGFVRPGRSGFPSHWWTSV